MIVYYQVECTELCPCRTLQQRARADRLKSSPIFSLFVEEPIPVWQVHFLTGLEPILPLVDLHNILWGWGGLRPHHPHPGIVIVIALGGIYCYWHLPWYCYFFLPHTHLITQLYTWVIIVFSNQVLISRNCDHCWPLLIIADHCWPPVQWQNAEAQLELESDTVTFLRG